MEELLAEEIVDKDVWIEEGNATQLVAELAIEDVLCVNVVVHQSVVVLPTTTTIIIIIIIHFIATVDKSIVALHVAFCSLLQ